MEGVLWLCIILKTCKQNIKRNIKMSKIKTVDYVVQELVKLGITDVFGLPGDYNFNIVEAVEKNKYTNW